ncbi:MAG: hypothetical protein HDS04_09055 [Bacteroides sp.]|nr:hypothetical protein [Bacteroides sp.]
MSKEMSAEYKATHHHIRKLLKDSTLTEMEKYSLLSSSISEVAHQYNGRDFAQIKFNLAIIAKTMLKAVEAAEKIFGTIK